MLCRLVWNVPSCWACPAGNILPKGLSPVSRRAGCIARGIWKWMFWWERNWLNNNMNARCGADHVASLCKSHFLQQLYRKIDGAVLRSQNEPNLDCLITFQTETVLQRFMLRFDQLQLDCNDHLLVYDGAHATGNYKVSCTTIRCCALYCYFAFHHANLSIVVSCL